MSLNIGGVGRDVAIVRDSDDKKYKKIKISVSDEVDDKMVKTFDSLSINSGRFQYIPDLDRDRDSIYIAGTAGSGKSFWVGQYLREYVKLYPDNKIFFFSESHLEDSAFRGISMKRVIIDSSWIEEPIDFHDFEDCCCIFDDIDALTGKLKKAVYELRDKLLKNSRKAKVSVLSTSHTFTGIDNKAVLNESDVIVFFMQNYNKSLKYLLENYVGLDNDGIKILKQIKSRWCAYVKSYPNVIITERCIFSIKKLQNY